MAVDGFQDELFDLILDVVPRRAIRQPRIRVLAEEARDMLPRRRKCWVDQRRDEHLDDRLARPAALACVEVRALHIGERWRDDDPRAQMDTISGTARELGNRL